MLMSVVSSLGGHWILDVRRPRLLAGGQEGLRRCPCRAELLDIGVHGAQVFVAGLADAPPRHRRTCLQISQISQPVALAQCADIYAPVRFGRPTPPAPP